MDDFFHLVDDSKTATWLDGLVFGPQSRLSLPDLRKRIPKNYPIRFYPDITHSVECQFPVPDWDSALAMTEGREVINPRPQDQANILRRYSSETIGFITYSEGCNDDVNKFVWSSLGWNPETMRWMPCEISGATFSESHRRGYSPGVAESRVNWRGPLATNSGVSVTLARFRNMEHSASPALLENWRFQQALYRAYYDAFVHSRLISETRQEEIAMGELRKAKHIGSLEAMSTATQILEKDPLTPAARAYRARVFELAEALFQSIHMQLSVPRYNAIALGRGANLDAIDFALNNRVWLKNRFEEIRAIQVGTGPAH